MKNSPKSLSLLIQEVVFMNGKSGMQNITPEMAISIAPIVDFLSIISDVFSIYDDLF